MKNESGSSDFGGKWSDEKLRALKGYLSSYAQALSRSPFERIYIDAFAGAGTVEIPPEADETGLFDEDLVNEDESYRHGSPLIALGIEPTFHKFKFIERNRTSMTELRKQVAAGFPTKLENTAFFENESNEALMSIARNQNWKAERAVAFLDPFALQVRWETIEAIARTEAIDMWLLFPAMAVNRMLPKSGVVPELWANKLTELFGTDGWERFFYAPEKDLFGEEMFSKVPRVFEKLSEFITMRLNQAFAGANEKPLILRNSKGAPLFLLCFACGNPKGAPIALRIANHIINKTSHGY